MIFLLIILKVDTKLNKNLKIRYFCTKPFTIDEEIARLEEIPPPKAYVVLMK